MMKSTRYEDIQKAELPVGTKVWPFKHNREHTNRWSEGSVILKRPVTITTFGPVPDESKFSRFIRLNGMRYPDGAGTLRPVHLYVVAYFEKPIRTERTMTSGFIFDAFNKNVAITEHDIPPKKATPNGMAQALPKLVAPFHYAGTSPVTKPIVTVDASEWDYTDPFTGKSLRQHACTMHKDSDGDWTHADYHLSNGATLTVFND